MIRNPAETASATVKPTVGVVVSVDGAAQGPDGLWRGYKSDISYTVDLNLDGSVRRFVNVVPLNPRVPFVGANERIIAHQPGTVVVGGMVGTQLQLRFDEWPDVEACDAP